MFGILRTLLAIVVLYSHLGGLRGAGAFSVTIFFVLSGFLMTLVMHESYGFTRGGRKRFVINRLLRLYPTYFLFMFFSLGLVLLAGHEFAIKYHGAMMIPDSVLAWFSNTSMIFVAHPVTNFEVRLLPATWALTVELFFYALICLGISKTFARTMTWLVISVVFTLVAFTLKWQTYGTFAGASLPFALGATAYFTCLHCSRNKKFIEWQTRSSRWIVVTTCSIMCILMLIGYLAVINEVRGLYPLISLACLAWSPIMVMALYFIKRPKASKLRKWDERIGELSYPI